MNLGAIIRAPGNGPEQLSVHVSIFGDGALLTFEGFHSIRGEGLPDFVPISCYCIFPVLSAAPMQRQHTVSHHWGWGALCMEFILPALPTLTEPDACGPPGMKGRPCKQSPGPCPQGTCILVEALTCAHRKDLGMIV